MKKSLLIVLAISVSGAVAWTAEDEKQPQAPTRSGLLEKYDKNKNGKLEQEERDALRKDREAERIKRYDKNGDGKIDEKERRAGFRQRREAPPAKEAPAKDAPAKQELKKDAPAPTK